MTMSDGQGSASINPVGDILSKLHIKAQTLAGTINLNLLFY
jgi:hypothetical protein